MGTPAIVDTIFLRLTLPRGFEPRFPASILREEYSSPGIFAHGTLFEASAIAQKRSRKTLSKVLTFFEARKPGILDQAILREHIVNYIISFKNKFKYGLGRIYGPTEQSPV